jgi:adenosylcobinamide-phosphate synthase
VTQVLLYSMKEITLMLAAAIVLDWVIGDPRGIPHPVIWIGRWISQMRDSQLGYAYRTNASPCRVKWLGCWLTASTVLLACAAVGMLLMAAHWVHPWLGYAVNTWFIATTIAVKGLKDAAMPILAALQSGDMAEARKQVGYIVGRDTAQLDAGEVSRAAVETVAENTVDAFVSPMIYALLGGAPLAMLYRAANTLDSMVGYKNEKYMHFGWASARFDDVLNYIPARITGFLIVLYSLLVPGYAGGRSVRAIARFAHAHPSPNSGIPESAVAGALGIELGGTNQYGGVISERARMGWPLRELVLGDIRHAVRILYGVSYLVLGGLLCAAVIVWQG